MPALPTDVEARTVETDADAKAIQDAAASARADAQSDPDVTVGDDEDEDDDDAPDLEDEIRQTEAAERQRIREEYKAELLAERDAERDAEAKKLGFKNYDVMMKAAKYGQRRRREEAGQKPADKSPAAAPDKAAPARRTPRGSKEPELPETAPDGVNPREYKRFTRELQRARAEKQRERQARIDAQKRQKATEQKFAALEARARIQRLALQSGVSPDEVDFALAEFREILKGKSKEELQTFKVDDWFGKDLRKRRPYLYGTTTTPADTSPPADSGAGEPGPKPQPRSSTPDDSRAAADTKKMTPSQFSQYLTEKGIRSPGSGLPS